MRNKWFISDTHFFHANILKFQSKEGRPLRPFNTIEEMHETMVERWNSVVKDGDNVYHLGDVTFKYDGAFNNLMSRLKGRKRLTLGNHDRIKGTDLIRWFEKVDLWKSFPEEGFTCSHMPLKDGHFRNGTHNVHGHVHSNSLDDPKYINVSVEVRDYTPVNIDTIVEEMK